MIPSWLSPRIRVIGCYIPACFLAIGCGVDQSFVPAPAVSPRVESQTESNSTPAPATAPKVRFTPRTVEGDTVTTYGHAVPGQCELPRSSSFANTPGGFRFGSDEAEVRERCTAAGFQYIPTSTLTWRAGKLVGECIGIPQGIGEIDALKPFSAISFCDGKVCAVSFMGHYDRVPYAAQRHWDESLRLLASRLFQVYGEYSVERTAKMPPIGAGHDIDMLAIFWYWTKDCVDQNSIELYSDSSSFSLSYSGPEMIRAVRRQQKAEQTF